MIATLNSIDPAKIKREHVFLFKQKEITCFSLYFVQTRASALFNITPDANIRPRRAQALFRALYSPQPLP